MRLILLGFGFDVSKMSSFYRDVFLVVVVAHLKLYIMQMNVKTTHINVF